MADPKSEVTPAASKPVETVTAKPVGKKGNKTILIVIVVLVGLCVLCSGIGLVLSMVLDKAGDELEDSLDEVNEEAIEDEIEDSLEESFGDDADVDFGIDGDADLPEDFPSDVELVDDTQIVSSSRIQSDNGEDYDFTIIAKVEDTTGEEIINGFKDSLEDDGWSLDSEIALFGSTAVFKKGNRDLTVIAFDGYEDGEDSTYTLTIVSN